MKLIISILLLLPFFAASQDPAHYFLGGEELSGAHIYDVEEDKAGDLWLATNSGLFKYDGYSFRRFINNEMSTNSLFNLCFDRDDNVYCNNLSGQVFRVFNDSLELYYQLPDSLMSSHIYITFDKEGDLFIVTRKVYYLNKHKQLLAVDKNKSYNVGSLTEGLDGGFYFLDYSSWTVYQVVDKSVELFLKLKKGTFPGFFYYKDDLVGFDLTTGDLIYSKGKLLEPKVHSKKERKNMYSDGEYFWTTHFTGGSSINKGLSQNVMDKPELLKSHIVSAFKKDSEGNIILGTFGDGLIIIPNMNATTFSLPDITDRPTKLVPINKQEVVVGTQSGKLYKLNSKGKLSLFSEINSKFVECLVFFQKSGELFVDDKSCHLINVNTHFVQDLEVGALKDGKQINDTTYLIATNSGVLFVNAETKKIRKCEGFTLRTNAVGYNEKTHSIYAGTALGLSIGKPGENNYFEINQQPVIASEITSAGDTIIVCTHNYGVLLFKDDKLIIRWDCSNGFPSNFISKTIPYKGNFVINSKEGVFISSSNGKVLKEIRAPEGLTVNDVTDIAVAGDNLYLTHTKGIEKIDLNGLPQSFVLPSFKIENIEVNEEKSEVWEGEIILRHDENRIGFRIVSKTLKYKEELHYKYMLSGIDKEWQLNEYDNNLIEYKSLPSGRYSFLYSIVCRGKTSEIKEVKFRIAQVFWKSTWFWCIIIVVIIIILLLAYRIQVKRQKIIAKHEAEVVESKLTAIQSQMNPHFIFNSLNSIQDLVLKKEGENAYHYISKFAYLVRRTLHSSQVDFIDIEEEIKLLDVYLELEKLRFNKEFKYEIRYADNLELEIPPMIIQPFVENAIKHGLLHKEGQKTLKIEFQFKGSYLLCTIEDNGIGREESMKIQKRKAHLHESFSVKSVQSRFEILKKVFGENLGLEFEDLIKNNEATGTKVLLKIPIKKMF